MNIFEQYDERIRKLENRLDTLTQAANIQIGKVVAVTPDLRVSYRGEAASTLITKKNIDVSYNIGDVVLVLVQDGTPIIGGRIG